MVRLSPLIWTPKLAHVLSSASRIRKSLFSTSSGTAWDPGLIIQYWIDQSDNDRLTDAELAFKSFALFAIAVWPR